MLTIAPIIPITSTVAPGVTYSVRNLNQIQRAAREFGLMDARYRISEIYDGFRELANELGIDPEKASVLELRTSDKATPAQAKRAAMLDMELRLIVTRDVVPAVIRAGLVSIAGVNVGESPADTESILSGDDSADALLTEIYSACDDAAGLLEEQRKNSESPAISNEPAAGDLTGSSQSAVPAES